MPTRSFDKAKITIGLEIKSFDFRIFFMGLGYREVPKIYLGELVSHLVWLCNFILWNWGFKPYIYPRATLEIDPGRPNEVHPPLPGGIRQILTTLTSPLHLLELLQSSSYQPSSPGFIAYVSEYLGLP